MRDRALGTRQGQIHGVGVTAKIITRFKKRERGPAVQLMRRRQTRNTGADNGHFHGAERPKPTGKVGEIKILNINWNLLVIL